MPESGLIPHAGSNRKTRPRSADHWMLDLSRRRLGEGGCSAFVRLPLLPHRLDDLRQKLDNLRPLPLLIVELPAEIIVRDPLLPGRDVRLARHLQKTEQALVRHRRVARAEPLALRLDPLVDARL